MIVVKFEIWPHGDKSRKREIGRLNIANIGINKENPRLCDYDYSFTEFSQDGRIITSSGTVPGWDKSLGSGVSLAQYILQTARR